MCLTPVKLPNPHFRHSRDKDVWRVRDTTSAYIYVPCGHCASCVNLRQVYLIQRCQMMYREHDLWMCTLSYKQSMVPIRNVNGYHLKYASLRDLQNFIKRLRRHDVFGMPFSYIAVNEYGGQKHRPHWHLIFATKKIPGQDRSDLISREIDYHDKVYKEWSRNFGTIRNPRYVQICDLIITKNGRTFDFHWVDPWLTSNGQDDVAFYVTKYCLKSDPWVDRLKSALWYNVKSNSGDCFSDLWMKYFRPRLLMSKDFGGRSSENVREYIQECIDFSLSNFTSFKVKNEITGQWFPMAPFYRPLIHYKDYVKMFDKCVAAGVRPPTGEIIPDFFSDSEIASKSDHQRRIDYQIYSKDVASDFYSDLLDQENFNEFDCGIVKQRQSIDDFSINHFNYESIFENSAEQSSGYESFE